MLSPYVNEFLYEVNRITDGTQPAGGQGVSVTPAQNAFGTYAQILGTASSLPIDFDCYELEILVNNSAITGTARDTMVTIGFDEAGGTTYTDKILHLVCGPTSLAADSGEWPAGGVTFKFPLRIKAGTSIAAKASVNSATLTAFQVSAIVRGKPTHPELIWAGSGVETIGASTGTSAGTGITSGGADEGAYTLLGSSTKRYRYMELGVGYNSAGMFYSANWVDIGIDAASTRRVIRNADFRTDTNETLTKRVALTPANVPAGSAIYARVQSTTASQTPSIAVYGVY
ncbi:MAG: hypothetical protein H0U12_07105 [Thermoleophilaceae bacterium]|nr:hypothetical protein [Thermoleophilaceae bacterium]